jgi:hypothetical protein
MDQWLTTARDRISLINPRAAGGDLLPGQPATAMITER